MLVNERDIGRGELGALRRGLADQIEQLGPRPGAQDPKSDTPTIADVAVVAMTALEPLKVCPTEFDVDLKPP